MNTLHSAVVHLALELHAPTTARRPQFPTAEESAAYNLLNKTRASILDDSWPAKVSAFRHLYSLARHDQVACTTPLTSDRTSLHERLLTEEFTETLDASTAHDLPETVDGLLDLIYVALGWLCELGLTPVQINILMQEVHASNLTKVDEDGKPIYDEQGKVLKGAQYRKADIAGLLEAFANEAASGHAD